MDPRRRRGGKLTPFFGCRSNSPLPGDDTGGMAHTTGWRMPGPPEPEVSDRSPRRLGLVGGLLWPVVLGALGSWLLARLWPDAPPGQGVFWVAVSWAALMCAAFAMHIGLVAGVVAVLSLLLRRWRLTAAAAVTGGLLLAAPVMLILRPEAASPLPASDGTELRVMSVNLNYALADIAPILDQIDGAEPDVILFQELTPELQTALEGSLGEQYPHRATIPRLDAFGQGVFSRRPFLQTPHNRPPGGHKGGWNEPQIGVRIDFAGRELELWNIHLLPPVSIGAVARQHANAAALREMVIQGATPVVLGGDFNAPRQAGPVRGLLRAGLRSAHAEAGHGLGLTWPLRLRLRVLNTPPVTLPGVQIDHILYSPSLECVHAAVGEEFGSDHRAVLAVLRWRN